MHNIALLRTEFFPRPPFLAKLLPFDGLRRKKTFGFKSGPSEIDQKCNFACRLCICGKIVNRLRHLIIGDKRSRGVQAQDRYAQPCKCRLCDRLNLPDHHLLKLYTEGSNDGLGCYRANDGNRVRLAIEKTVSTNGNE